MASLAPPGESAQGIESSHQFGRPVTSQKLEPWDESISMQTWWLPASSSLSHLCIARFCATRAFFARIFAWRVP